MAKTNIHVVPNTFNQKKEDKWAVLKEGNKRPTGCYTTQSAAIKVARDLAQTAKSEMIIHDRDGEVRRTTSFSENKVAKKASTTNS